MRKIYLLIIVGLSAAILLGSCTDFNEQFEGLEDVVEPTNFASYEHELTAADYSDISSRALAIATNAEDSAKASSISSNKYFTSTVPAADYVPLLLGAKYPYGDLGSTAMITYAFGEDKPSYLNDLRTINILENSDYQLAWESETAFVNCFTPAVSPEDNLPEILASRFPSAIDGQFKFIEYNYSSVEATSEVTDVDYYTADFDTQTAYDPINSDWINIDVQGSLVWQARSYSGNLYAQISSYNSGAINEAYLITPEIDLSNAIEPEFTFDVKIGYWNANCLSVWVSEDFDGTESGIATANWVDISNNFTFPETPTNGYSEFVSAGIAELDDYIGKKVFIAFKYDGDGRSSADRGDDPAKTTTYQIDNVAISEVKSALTVPSTEKYYIAYFLDGSTWKQADESFVALQTIDYETIGRPYFYSSIVPEYIPRFLKNKFPYALEGDVKTAIYKSGSNPTYSGATQYTYNGEEWLTEDFIENKTEQFVYSNQGWLFDPTIVYTMEKPDYQIMVDYVKNNIDPGYIDSYGTAEYYYGFGSYYANVSLRLSYRNSYAELDAELSALESDEEKVELLYERLKEGMKVFTQLKFPDAEPFVSGIEVNYKITTYIYYTNGVSAGNAYRMYTFKCTEAASGDTPPQFEYISDEVIE